MFFPLRNRVNHEIGAVLDEPFSEFDLDRRLKFVDALRNYHNDNDPKNIVIRTIESGSVHLTWYNESLVNKDCAEINAVTDKVQDESGQVNAAFEEHFKNAGFKVDKVVVKKLGKFLGFVAPPFCSSYFFLQ